MTDKKRAENRPRLDAILRAIREGKYDDVLPKITEALVDRQSKRREALMAEIQEVWGENAQVVVNRGGVTPRSMALPNIPIPSAGSGVDPVLDPNEGVVADDADDPGDSDIESRSPVIS